MLDKLFNFKNKIVLITGCNGQIGKKISELMRGTGKGIKEFKKALKDDEEQEEKD